MKRAAVIVVLALVCAGCVTQRTLMREVLRDPKTGVVTSDTKIATTVTTFAGSKAQDGAGRVLYSGTRSGTWKLDVGQTAHGLEAGGEPAAVLREASPSLLKLLDLWMKP